MAGEEMNTAQNLLHVICPSFHKNGEIQKKHTGFGEDVSPQWTNVNKVDK